jgi:hypothetical protein
MGKKVCQIACGRMHTICITDRNELIGFGLNSGGQLGVTDDQNIRLPTVINICCPDNQCPSCVSAGGDQSFCGILECKADRDLKINNYKKTKG